MRLTGMAPLKNGQEFIDLISPRLINSSVFEEKVTAIVEKVLLTSELRPIKRIAELETVTGLNDYSDLEEEDDHEPSIPEGYNRLRKK